MFEKLSLKNRLFLSVAILAVALLVEAVVGLQASKNMADNMQKVYDSSQPLNSLKKVSDAYSVGIAGAVMNTRAGQGWEMGRDQLEKSIRQADDSWRAYLDRKDISEEEKIPVAVVNATLKDNSLFLMQLRESFEQKDAKSLEGLADSNLFAVVSPITEQMDKLIDLKWQESEKIIEAANKSFNFIFLFMVLLALASLGLGLGISLSVAMGVSRKFKDITGQLVGSAGQVSVVSERVLGASGQQAKGAAEAARNLEQTNLALSTMSAMTLKNADGATRASRLMDQTQATMVKSNQSMENTLSAMKTINESAGKISRIVKSIEEIALQTNILSLNASVEAARAGEHGKGFAVVAEEVRSLAQRCALAAKETSQLIQDNAYRATSGMQVTQDLGVAQKEMLEQAHRVANLLGEIESTSLDQSKAIQEITSKMSQLETVSQGHTANAIETAAASEDMSRQASGLKTIIRQLVSVVEGDAREKPELSGSSLNSGKPKTWFQTFVGGRLFRSNRKKGTPPVGTAAREIR